MTDDEIIAVVQAHKEGKRIQSKHLKDDIWMNNPSEFQWNFGIYEYRVAPEPRKPREWDVLVSCSGLFIESPRVYPYPETPEKHETFFTKTIRVREVLENE